MKSIYTVIFFCAAFIANAGNIIIYQLNEDNPYSGVTTVTWNNGANSLTLDPSDEETIINVEGVIEISSVGAATGDNIGMEFEETGAFVFNFENPIDGIVYSASLPTVFDDCPDIENIPCDSDGDQSTTGDSFDNACACQVLLPVELSRFEAFLNEDSVTLEWQTLSEMNNEAFVIERSFDGMHFERIGKVAGVGNSTEIQNYKFLDLVQRNGTIYYRLKQIDFDGTFEYSNVISIQSEVENIEIFPNPAKDEVKIILAKKYKNTLLSLHEAITGKLIKFERLNEISEFEFDVSMCQPGNYILKIGDNKQHLIIQN